MPYQPAIIEPIRGTRMIGRSPASRTTAASGGATSVAVTVRVRRPWPIVAVPAARRLCTQLTSPNAENRYSRPPVLRIATGNVLGWPVLRPRTVSRTLGPIGRPRRNARRTNGLVRSMNPGADAGGGADFIVVTLCSSSEPLDRARHTEHGARLRIVTTGGALSRFGALIRAGDDGTRADRGRRTPRMAGDRVRATPGASPCGRLPDAGFDDRGRRRGPGGMDPPPAARPGRHE